MPLGLTQRRHDGVQVTVAIEHLWLSKAAEQKRRDLVEPAPGVHARQRPIPSLKEPDSDRDEKHVSLLSGLWRFPVQPPPEE